MTMRVQPTCFGCGSSEWSLVFEFNGLVLLEYMRQSDLARYDYAICHRCGLVFATRRPEGEDLQFLYSRFDEFLGRTDATTERVEELTPHARAQLDRQVSAGWLVSEEASLGEDEWLQEVLTFRVYEAYHTDIIAALVPLEGARILELRSLDGCMLQQFRRRYGAAEVIAMPMSERHRVIIEALHGIPAPVIDFDEMTLPAGTFDLVIARHMMTHALDPGRFWPAVTEAVAPGGWLYLYLENDDAVMFAKRKNLIGEMKCFHFQNFDLPCLARVLRSRGFEPRFVRHTKPGKSEMVCLARRESTRFEPIGQDALMNRREMYEQWRALSILSAPSELRKGFATEIEGLTRLVRERGLTVRDRQGQLVPIKMRLLHVDGYARLNERAPSGE